MVTFSALAQGSDLELYSKLRAFYEGKRVVVAGVTGFLGTNCAIALWQAGAKVIGIARRQTPSASAVCDEVISVDFGKKGEGLSALSEASVVFDCLGYPGLAPSDLDPVGDFEAEFRPHINLLVGCTNLSNAPRVVYVSSRLVYGTPLALPVDEDHPLRPRSLYAAHKLLIENYIEVLSKTNGLQAIVFRLSSPYGPNGGSSAGRLGVWNQFIQKAVRGETLHIYGSGEQLRDFVYIDDVVIAFLLAAANDQCVGQTFNLGGERAISLREGVGVIAKEAGGVPVQYVPWPVAAHKVETGDYRSSLAKVRSFLDLPPQTPFEEGIRRTIEAIRSEKSEARNLPHLVQSANDEHRVGCGSALAANGVFQDYKIMIIGAGGFLGTHLVGRFLSQGALVSAVGRSMGQSSPFFANPLFTFSPCDLMSDEATRHVVKRHKPDIVIYVAAAPDGDETGDLIRNRVNVNLLGLINVLEACREHAAQTKFLFGDSRKVYGNAPVPHSSTTILSPLSSYAFTKETGWHLCQLYSRLHGMTVISVRPSMIYGPGQRSNVIQYIWEAALRGEGTIRLLGGLQTRDPLFIDDAVDAFVAVAQKATQLAHNTINIGGLEEINIVDLARLVLDVCGSKATVVSDHGALRSTEMQRSVCDLSEAADLLGWFPRIGLREGIKLTFGSQLGERTLA